MCKKIPQHNGTFRFQSHLPTYLPAYLVYLTFYFYRFTASSIAYLGSRPSSSFRTGRYTVHVACESLFTHSDHSHHFAIDARVEPKRKVPDLIDIPSFPYMYLTTRHFCSLAKCCLLSIHPFSSFFFKGKGKFHSKVPDFELGEWKCNEA